MAINTTSLPAMSLLAIDGLPWELIVTVIAILVLAFWILYYYIGGCQPEFERWQD